MSLLEDLFLEDEAGEARELERVLEDGADDEFGERPVSPTSDDNEERDDEAEEDKRRVDPTKVKEKRIIKNPRFVLNPARLTGPRGIHVIPDHYKDFKFKGKGHEKEDLDMVLKKLEHWAYRLYPKFAFQDCLKKIEMLGKKKTVMVHLTKIRSDQYTSDETVVQKDSSEDEAGPPEEDEFDKLLQQQIELARSTPAPGSVKKAAFSTPSVDRSQIMPKATSSPSISDEQRQRMLRNRQLAEERRLAKLRNDNNADLTNIVEKSVEGTLDLTSVQEKTDSVVRKQKNNVFDSSDEEDANGPITHDFDVNKKQQSTENKGTIDLKNIPAPTGNTSGMRQNRSDVIDSDEEDNENSENNVTLDLTNIPVQTSIVRTKNNKLNVEISKEDSAGNVDVYNRGANISDQPVKPVGRKHNKSNILESPSKDAALNELITIYDNKKNCNQETNATVHWTNIPGNSNVVGRKQHRSDEEEATVVNESITIDVDVHKNVESARRDVAIIDTPKINEETDVARDIDVNTNYDFVKIVTAKFANVDTENNAVFHNMVIDSTKDVIMESTDKYSKSSVNVIKNESFKNVEPTITDGSDLETNAIIDITKDKNNVFVNNKENMESNIAEDIMDVDFDDDF